MRAMRPKEPYPTAKKVQLCGVRGRAPPPGPQARPAQGPLARGRKARREGPPALPVDLPLYSFARPETGEVHWLILPAVNNAEVFSMALESFAREVGAGKSKNARPARARPGRLAHGREEAEGARGDTPGVLLPSHYSPEPQPSERLRVLSEEGVAKRHYEEIEELEEAYSGFVQKFGV